MELDGDSNPNPNLDLDSDSDLSSIYQAGPGGAFLDEDRDDHDTDSDISDLYAATPAEAAAAMADAGSDIGDGGMLLAPLSGGQLAVESVPTGNLVAAALPISGPFNGDWFAPIALQFLEEASDESDAE